MSDSPQTSQPNEFPPNARLFVRFRLFFNCRFYYPIFTILFLDLGLSIAEFATLNVVWAVTIVLLEVPSGALADRLGRRRLVVWAGWLMVAEMAVICAMPVGNHTVVFWLFVANRILSGAAEAAASGADEALTYDSLPEDRRSTMWPRVMAKLSRAMAIGFIISSVSGSFLYDHEKVNALLSWLGWSSELPKAVTIKIPLVMNLLTGVACLLTAMRMKEKRWTREGDKGFWADTRDTTRQILETGAWMWRTPAAFGLLLFGVLFDSMVRLFLTVASNFYRMVGVAEAWYGVIATVASMLGLVTAGLMERLSEKHTARTNLIWLGFAIFISLWFIAHPADGWAGIAMAMPLMLAMRFLHFFLSHYLNAVVDSERRATALSFRGLTMNLAYGGMTLLFGWQSRYFERRLGVSADDPQVFATALTWWPWWFAGSLVVGVVWYRARFPRRLGA
jgi:MFS family permease